jgi:hypothetical protein
MNARRDTAGIFTLLGDGHARTGGLLDIRRWTAKQCPALIQIRATFTSLSGLPFQQHTWP